MIDQTKCSNCTAAVQINEERCPTCGTPTSPPNVKLARTQRTVLTARAEAARAEAKGRGLAGILDRLETLLAASQAVVSVRPEFLHQFFVQKKTLYSTYQRQIGAGLRRPATPADDRDRAAVEGKLYGGGGSDIVYAALSLDGRGLTSYGPAAMQLREVAIAGRASVLEENSYDFMKRHDIRVLGPVPEGFLGDWAARAEVVMAKLAPRLQRSTEEHHLASMTLASAGKRGADEFVEVHIWGGFDANAVCSVQVVDQTCDDEERQLLALSRHEAGRRNIDWHEA